MTDFDTIKALRSQGLSFAQIGANLGITKDAARGTFTRGLAGLKRTQSAADGPCALCGRSDAAPAADGGDRGRDVLLPTGEPRRDRPGDLHGELRRQPATACKLCRYLSGLAPDERTEWEHELALPDVPSPAIVRALERREVYMGESSVKRHRKNHVAR